MFVIDPSKGGSEVGISKNNYYEKDFNLLISDYIYNRLKQLGADVKIIRTGDENISEKDRIDKILNSYGNNSKVVAISNTLGNESDAQIVYALRNKSTLANMIANNLESSGLPVSKYYQRRSETDTSKDYYNLQKDTGLIETIIINYGNDIDKLNNNYKEYGEAIVKALANYKNISYFDEENEYIYVVKKGDSLYKIANEYNTTVDKIKELNNLNSNLLNIGDKLLIPVKKANDDEESYVVQKGDNLYKIANMFNTTVDKIKKLNNLSSNLINIGQVLVINSENNKSNIYVVKKGDNLYKIANTYNTTVDNIKKLNNLSSNLLSIGQELLINSENDIPNIYVVKKGDNLYQIANAYNTTVDNIKKLNNLSSNIISIGQQLKIPI